MRKLKFLLLALVIMTTVLPGCSRYAGSSAASEAVGAELLEPVKLKFSMWGNDAQKMMYEDLITEFKKTHSNIDIEIVVIPFADYQQKLSIMLASRTAPDVGWLADRMIPQLIESGQLADISPSVMNDNDYNLSDINPSTLSLFRRDDRLYGIPFSTPPVMMYYNMSLFRDKGLKTPTELYKEGKWTYEQFIHAAKAIAEPDSGVYGVKLVRDWNNWSDALLPLIWSHGADLFTKDGNAFALNSAEGREALQLYSDLMFKDGVHPQPGDEIGFESGNIGMYSDRYSYMSKARAITEFEWDIAPMPEGVTGRGTSLGYAGYSVFDTENSLEAVEFLKYITNPTSMGVTSQYFVPSRKSVLDSDVFMNSASQPSAESIQLAVLDQMSEARIAPGHRNWQEIDVKIQTLLDHIYTQSSSVEKVLKQMETEVNANMK
ncbi:sugar ABC transporter substrate-binding protein [Paenibacillus sonchi]|uniref:Sugar ABC transporter substrate-binding protein n=1 Tax=Paenibacillus sonchi TaxID=373687 RepID=A0A974SDD0_9BACL|nr:sugar ABC transporter substrate-binding protein [Paenibacillus sonchi]QQZ61299.1 sugar ABC transporter substrate-binding protein [Paenibacillus sonchi]